MKFRIKTLLLIAAAMFGSIASAQDNGEYAANYARAPRFKALLHLYCLQAVQNRYIKIPYNPVITGRVPGSHDHPATRKTVVSEALILQKLKHGREKSFGDTVYLIKEQYPLFIAGLYSIINGCDYLA